MTNELKPCPFCGGEAESWYTQDDFWCAGRAGCANEDCCIRPVARGTNEDDAINIWNTRYKRTCRVVPMDYFGQPPYYRGSIVSDALSDGCSECGYPFDTINKGVPIFCPNCGAEVIDGDS